MNRMDRLSRMAATDDQTSASHFPKFVIPSRANHISPLSESHGYQQAYDSSAAFRFDVRGPIRRSRFANFRSATSTGGMVMNPNFYGGRDSVSRLHSGKSGLRTQPVRFRHSFALILMQKVHSLTDN
jgi:hypothetical protein